MIAHRIPIMDEGKVIAVLGTVLFQDVQAWFLCSTSAFNCWSEVR